MRDLWWQGLPPSVRGKVWSLAVGNELNITPGERNPFICAINCCINLKLDACVHNWLLPFTLMAICFMLPELYEIFLSRAKERWKCFSETGSEIEMEGKFFIIISYAI